MNNLRPAFSMLTAIFVIVIMATVSVFILDLSGKMVTQTTEQYQREQAILLANSYTEFALLSVTANDHTQTSCLNNISGKFNNYKINIKISYIATNGTVNSSCRILSDTVSDLKSPLSIIIDVFIEYPKFDHPDNLMFTYHKRSLHKI